MNKLTLTAQPRGQQGVALILNANYQFPLTSTPIRVENFERMPSGPAYIAMNHTDRYNYWPFQVQLWKERNEYTATWVKGKYYNKPLSRKFMIATNNIPTPSRGYLITADCHQCLRKAPPQELYKLIRTATENSWEDAVLLERGSGLGFRQDLERLFKTPRDILGLDFNPFKHGFVERHRELFRQMMDRFIELNEEAFDKGLRIIVFPEGTRSVRLTEGKPGLAQMALRMGATIVPVGCNGSDKAYPGNIPFSRGGEIIYRVGEPLTPDGALAPFRITEKYRPFTDEATKFADKFEGATSLVMDHIRELLDPRYQEGPTTEVEGADRFI